MLAASIRTLVRPAKLYRYRSLTDRHGQAANTKAKQEYQAINQSYLWSSTYKDMNDPMEGLYIGDETFREKPALFAKLFDSKMAVGIVSFSETATNELMWAHYTDTMRGICIEYDVSRLLKALNSGDELVRVTYDEDLPHLTWSNSADRLARRILSRKNHRWSQEREWRLLTSRINRVYYNNQECITGIILGPNMDKRHYDYFRSLDSHYDISVIHVKGYRLELRGISEPLPFKIKKLPV